MEILLIFLAGGGGVSLLFAAFSSDSIKRLITVDPYLRQIIIVDTKIKATDNSNSNINTITFDDVVKVYLDDDGDDDYPVYDVFLKLKNGRKISLFGIATFDDRHSESKMENRRKKLEIMLRTTL